MLVNAEKIRRAVAAAIVAVVIKGELAFHRAVAKKNKGHSSSAIINTLQLDLSMTMVKNMSGPKPYHNNLAMVTMLLQNIRSVHTYHLDSYS